MIDTISSLQSFGHLISTLCGYDSLGVFIDNEGRLSLAYSYYHTEFFGKQYPNRYYTIENGVIAEYSCGYDYIIDEEHATWTRETEDLETRYASATLMFFSDYDTQNNVSYYGAYTYLTQNIFNTDDDWEYIMPIVENYQEEGNIGDYGITSDNKLMVRRHVYLRTRFTGYKVLKENGSTIWTIAPTHHNCERFNIEFIWKFGGNIYLYADEYTPSEEGDGEHYTTLYLINRESSSIQAIQSVKQPFATVNNGNIQLKLNGLDASTNAILYSTSGQLIHQQRIPLGVTHSNIPTQDLPNGTYHVALERAGQIVNSQKVILK